MSTFESTACLTGDIFSINKLSSSLFPSNVTGRLFFIKNATLVQWILLRSFSSTRFWVASFVLHVKGREWTGSLSRVNSVPYSVWMTDSIIRFWSKYSWTLYEVRRSNLGHGTLALDYNILINIFGELAPETYTSAKDYKKIRKLRSNKFCQFMKSSKSH